MNAPAKHTPWRVEDSRGLGQRRDDISDAQGRIVASFWFGDGSAHDCVRCVNAHDDLLTSLREVLSVLDRAMPALYDKSGKAEPVEEAKIARALRVIERADGRV